MHTKSLWERAKPKIDVLSGISVIATMIFIAYQSYEMKEGGKDTHDLAVAAGKQADAAGKQADAVGKEAANTHDLAVAAATQATNTGDLALSAGKQAVAAEQSVETIQEQMRLDQRAWVSVSVGEKAGNFAVSMRNTGKTPAMNVTDVTAFSGGGRMRPPEVDLSRNSSSPIPILGNLAPDILTKMKQEGFIRDRPPTGYVIAPGDAQISSDYQGTFAQIFKIDADRAYVQGRVTYDDVFGKSHETVFCFWYAPPSDFVMCNDHNKMN
jgi:hypothetical protein